MEKEKLFFSLSVVFIDAYWKSVDPWEFFINLLSEG